MDEDQTPQGPGQELALPIEVRHKSHNNRDYYVVIDVIAYLTGSKNPRRYWSDLKRRVGSEGFAQVCSKIIPLKMKASDGRRYSTDCVDAETLREICHFVPAAAPWRRKDKPGGTVYAIGLPDGNMVKIGTTTDLTGRLRSLRYNSPVPLVILWQMPGNSELERRLHTHFAHRRAHGEWFSFADADVVAELQAYRAH
jgi:hypothetical protein